MRVTLLPQPFLALLHFEKLLEDKKLEECQVRKFSSKFHPQIKQFNQYSLYENKASEQVIQPKSGPSAFPLFRWSVQWGSKYRTFMCLVSYSFKVSYYLYQGKASLSNAPKRPFSRRRDRHFNIMNGRQKGGRDVGNVMCHLVYRAFLFRQHPTNQTSFHHSNNRPGLHIDNLYLVLD